MIHRSKSQGTSSSVNKEKHTVTCLNKTLKIEDKENYILQRKVTYAPLFEDINGEFSKAEIRLLFAWNSEEENPELLVNLVRMTKAAMVNVDFNKKDAIWIGSSMAFFEK